MEHVLRQSLNPIYLLLSLSLLLGSCSSTTDTPQQQPQPTPEEPVVEEPTLLELIQSRDDLSIFARDIELVNTEEINFENGFKPPSLEDLLNEEAPRTVFAPTNAAYRALFEEFDTTEEEYFDFAEFAPGDAAVGVLYHIIDGAFTLEQLQEGQELPLTIGEWGGTSAALTVTLQGGAKVNGVVNGAAISAADLTASNGVVHLIDAVLLFEE